MDNNKKLEKTKKEDQKKQLKVGITEKGNVTLGQFMELVNKTSKRKIRIPEVLEFAVEKLSDRDIRKIQERVYTPDDKMEVMFEEYNSRNPDKPLSRDQFKIAMVEAFEKQVLAKSHKLPKADPLISGDDI